MPEMVKLTLVGLMSTAAHRKAYEAGQYLVLQRGESFCFDALQQVPSDYGKWRKAAPEVVQNVAGDCVVITQGSDVVYSSEEFVSFVKKTCGFKLFDLPDDDPDSYASMAQRAYHNYLRSTGTCFSWMDIAIDGQPPSRIVFQLYSKTCPKTVENFRHLCAGDLPAKADEKGEPLRMHYKDTTMFRIVKDGWIQGGDISNTGTMKAGHGGTSIFGPSFPDESYDIAHSCEGILGMANNGPHTNKSQFYITAATNTWMDSRFVAFGRVIEGMDHVRTIHACPTKANQAPTVPITVVDCGLLDID